MYQLIILITGYHMAVFISTHISSPSVGDGLRHGWGQLSTEGLIQAPI